MELVRTAVTLSGATGLCLTKLDVLTGLETIQVSTGYLLDHQRVGYADLDSYGLAEAQPVYESFRGWDKDLTGVRDYRDLPAEARTYVEFIESWCSAPVQWISVGPEREAIIRR